MRGKQRDAAERRRLFEEAIARDAAQQREITQLTTQLAELQQRYADETHHLREQVNVMRHRLQEGESDTVLAQRKELEDMRARTAKERDLAVTVVKLWQHLLYQMVRYLRLKERRSKVDATLQVACWVSDKTVSTAHFDAAAFRKEFFIEPRSQFGRLLDEVEADSRTWGKSKIGRSEFTSLSEVVGIPETAERMGVTVPDDMREEQES